MSSAIESANRASASVWGASWASEISEPKRARASTDCPLSSSRLIAASSWTWDGVCRFVPRARSRTRARARSTTALSDNSSFVAKIVHPAIVSPGQTLLTDIQLNKLRIPGGLQQLSSDPKRRDIIQKRNYHRLSRASITLWRPKFSSLGGPLREPLCPLRFRLLYCF